MTVTIRQVGPCFAGEVDGIDMRRPLTRRRDRRDPCRHGQVRRAGVPRPEDHRRPAARLHAEPGRHRARHRHQPARRQRDHACPRPSPTSPTSTRTTSPSPATTAAGCSPSATGCGTPTARSRRCRRSTRCCTPSASRRRAATPSSPTCARPTTRSTTRPRPRSRTWSASTRRCSRAQLIGFTDFTDEERERFKPVRQCMVRTHPVTGRKSLYLVLACRRASSAGRCRRRAAFLRDLIEHATQREFVYTHKWRVDDLVMWDNRQTMHRARPFPAHEPRDMRRTTLAGDGPTAEQVAA